MYGLFGENIFLIQKTRMSHMGFKSVSFEKVYMFQQRDPSDYAPCDSAFDHQEAPTVRISVLLDESSHKFHLHFHMDSSDIHTAEDQCRRSKVRWWCTISPGFSQVPYNL